LPDSSLFSSAGLNRACCQGLAAQNTGGLQMRTIRRRDDRGAAAVEFALVLPILVLLLFGMVTTGIAYSDHLSVTNAVREGARYGAAVDYTASGWATSVRDRVEQVYFNAGGTLTNAQICVRLVNESGATVGTDWSGASCGTAPSWPSGMASGSCAVMVWVRKPQQIELIVAPDLNFNIGAKSVAYYGRTVSPGCTADS
jgi:Flp pilus assembly protein TadG